LINYLRLHVCVNRSFVLRVGLVVRVDGVLSQHEDVLSTLTAVVDAAFSSFLTPRGVPFNLITSVTSNTHLLRFSDLHAYDVTTPVSRENVGTIEAELLSRFQEMSASGKYLSPGNIIIMI